MSEPHTLDILGQIVLGRYRIVRQLARGGMGAVYLGRTEGAQGFARPVVVKRILPWLTDERGISEMFVREARILSNMQHPSIVSVLDFGQQRDGSYLMVLDYVHGYELSEWHAYVSKVRARVPVEYALHILCKVLDALHYAHTLKRADGKALGIVHRDVTPTNVFLSDRGEVKLLDFGIALVANEERKFTGQSEVRGKLPYLPAEVCAGSAPSPASDVYSAGVMLYELLTGINPFDGRQPAEIFRKIVEAQPLPVSAVRRDAPTELDDVLACAMSRDLSTRFATAAEFAQAIRSVPRRPEDVVAAELAEQLRNDFGALPVVLGVDSLEGREQAWRGPPSMVPEPPEAGDRADAPPDLGSTLSCPPPTPEQGASDAAGAELEQAAERPPAETTLCATAPPEVVHRAVRSSPPPASAWSRSSGHSDASRSGSPSVAASGPAPRSAATSISLSRVLLVASGAGVLAASAVLVAWLAVSRDAPVQERMVVISKESAASPGPASPAPAAGNGALDPGAEALEPVTAELEAAPLVGEPEPDKPDVQPSPPPAAVPARAPRSAAAPDAQELSRTFARKQRFVQGCFTKHAAGQSDLPQVSIHFHVAANGSVDDARLSPESLAGQPLGRCLLDVAKRTRFGPLQRAVSFHIPISAEKVLRSSL